MFLQKKKEKPLLLNLVHGHNEHLDWLQPLDDVKVNAATSLVREAAKFSTQLVICINSLCLKRIIGVGKNLHWSQNFNHQILKAVTQGLEVWTSESLFFSSFLQIPEVFLISGLMILYQFKKTSCIDFNSWLVLWAPICTFLPLRFFFFFHSISVCSGC